MVRVSTEMTLTPDHRTAVEVMAQREAHDYPTCELDTVPCTKFDDDCDCWKSGKRALDALLAAGFKVEKST